MLRFAKALRSTASAAIGRGPSSAALRALQGRKLSALLKHAHETVPFYRAELERSGISAADLNDPNILARLPILSKEQHQHAGQALLSERYPAARRQTEQTTGSSGRPFATHFDREYVHMRNLRFLRGLICVGYRPGHKLMLITERRAAGRSRLRRWLYSSLYAPPEEQARQFRRDEPDFLYGSMTPLRMLGRHLDEGDRSFRPPRCVISTAEMLDAHTRQQLERTFRAPVVDFYGLTEMGLVAWQTGPTSHYTIAADSVLVERIPIPGSPGRDRLVMTNLDLWAMPLIRYDTGDIGTFAADEQLTRIEGRSVDCILTPDGRTISPYQLTSALQDVTGLQQFRIRQIDIHTIQVELRRVPADAAGLAEAVSDRIGAAVGPDVLVQARFVDALPPGPGGKFRLVESLIGT